MKKKSYFINSSYDCQSSTGVKKILRTNHLNHEKSNKCIRENHFYRKICPYQALEHLHNYSNEAIAAFVGRAVNTTQI